MKYAWIAGQREAYPLPAMCTTLGVLLLSIAYYMPNGSAESKRPTPESWPKCLFCLVAGARFELATFGL